MRRVVPIRMCRGNVAVEYAVVVALVSVALFSGRPAVIERVVGALSDHYQRFTWALSQP
jgi:Flp pilus assembly pilin Flp